MSHVHQRKHLHIETRSPNTFWVPRLGSACTTAARVHAEHGCVCAQAEDRRAEPVPCSRQAQAAGRAGGAAKRSSSRYLKLRGEQRERRNLSAHGKSGTPRAASPRHSARQKETFTEGLPCFWLHFLLFLLSFFHVSIWGAMQGARCTGGGGGGEW